MIVESEILKAHDIVLCTPHYSLNIYLSVVGICEYYEFWSMSEEWGVMIIVHEKCTSLCKTKNEGEILYYILNEYAN